MLPYSLSYLRLLSGGKCVTFENPEYNDPSTYSEREGQYRKWKMSPLGSKLSRNRSKRRNSVTRQKEKENNRLQEEADQNEKRAVTFNKHILTLKDPKDEANELETAKPILKPWNSNENVESEKSQDEIRLKEQKSVLSMQVQTERSLDIIIYGASGTLGSYTVLKAAKVLKEYKWGIAGRCNDKLSAVLRNVSNLTNVACQDIPTFIADANDMTALVNVMEQCQILINCCGPYEEYAPSVVEACLMAGTHYVDANFDEGLTKQLQSKFQVEAHSENIYVVTSCGFVSFVIDMGLNYIERQFSGTLNTVEAYSQYCLPSARQFVPRISYSTWKSGIATMTNAGNSIMENAVAFAEDFPKNLATNCINALVNGVLPLRMPTLTFKSLIAQTDVVNGVSIPLPLLDGHVIRASQEFISENEKKLPVHFKNYLTFPSSLFAFVALLWGVILFVLAQFPTIREFLIRFPRIFSLGMCSTNFIDKESAKELIFVLTFKGTGTDNRDKDASMLSGPGPTCEPVNPERPPEAFEKVVKLKICAKNPLFGIGCIALLSSAVTILKRTGLPKRGGVYTPGAAFRNTEILEEVRKHNIRFKYLTVT